jgi:hypothetical protein
MSDESSPKRWAKKSTMRARYGGVSNMTIERAVRDKRLPPPHFPLGNNTPFWDMDEVEETERKATLARRVPVAADRYQKDATAEETETAA